MTTLGFEVTQPLCIPEGAWRDDVAVIVVTGASYGGVWVLGAVSMYLPPGETVSLGEIETNEAPRRPDLAVAAACAWVEQHCSASGYRLHSTDDLNGGYGPDEAPFFCGVSFVIDRWVAGMRG